MPSRAPPSPLPPPSRSHVIGLLLGFVASHALNTPPEHRVCALTSIAFGNVGQLPLVFVSALCHDRGGVFYRSLGALRWLQRAR